MRKKTFPKGDTVVNSAQHFHDHSPHHIDEVIFKDNFHLIITFRNGAVKDIDAFSFINHKWKVRNFEKLKSNVDLFKNPRGVWYDCIDWLEDDFADIDSEFLWKVGKTIKRARKKSVFIKLKEFPCGLTLTTSTDESVLPDILHFHIFEHDFQVGVISVATKSNLEWLMMEWLKDFNQIKKYIRKNKELLTQIYYAKTTAEKKKLAKLLPDSPKATRKKRTKK